MIEIRGGSVLFDDAAAGGLFVGVMFIEDDSSPEVSQPTHFLPVLVERMCKWGCRTSVVHWLTCSCVCCLCLVLQLVNEAIMQTLTNTGMRIYGGHVYIATGQIRTYTFPNLPSYKH